VSGGWAWPKERREAYANDLEHPEHLLAVKDSLNQAKGDKAPINGNHHGKNFGANTRPSNAGD